MTDYQAILTLQAAKLAKALIHLQYSYQKILHLPEQLELLNEETLETWESFAARFCRVADIFLTKYLRTCIYLQDPGFNGTLRDIVNYAEKTGLIDKAEIWLIIRELRNISVHDYSDKDLNIFFQQLKLYCPFLLKLQSLVK